MNRKDLYEQVLKEGEALVDPNVDTIANMSNLAVLLKEKLQMHWVGFYRVVGDELLLGPFSGPIACTRIGFGKGVCGTAWQHKTTVIVPSVDEFPGHIACSPLSKSEIVVPCIKNEQVFAVLDIDSTKNDDFDEYDRLYLEKIVALL